MSRKNDHTLIELLEKVVPDNPSSEFTADVMEQLSLYFEKKLRSDASFQNLLNQDDNNLSCYFTENVLSTINSKHSSRFRPIINKKIGWIFTIAILALTGLSFFIGDGSQVVENSTHYNLSSFIEVLNISSQSVSVLFACSISLSCLLLVDYFFKNRVSH